MVRQPSGPDREAMGTSSVWTQQYKKGQDRGWRGGDSRGGTGAVGSEVSQEK